MKHNNLLFAFAVGCVLAFGIHEARADSWWLDRPVVAVSPTAAPKPVQRVEMIAPVISPLQSPVATPIPVDPPPMSEEAQIYVFCRQHNIPHPSKECWDAWNIYASRD